MNKIYLLTTSIFILFCSLSKGQNRALELDDIDDYVELSQHAGNLIFNSPATVEFWFMANFNHRDAPPSSATTGVIYSISNGFSDDAPNAHFNNIVFGNNWGIVPDNELITITNQKKTNGTLVASTGAYETTSNYANTWNHYAITYDGQEWKIYFNGIQQFTAFYSSPIFEGQYGKNLLPALSVAIGAMSSTTGPVGGYLNGKIDEFRLWNTIRTDTEIQENYNKIYNCPQPNLVAYYKFNQLENLFQGNAGINDIRDHSGNNYHGDVIGGAITTTDSPLLTTAVISCNDGDDCTINDIYLTDCYCQGTFQDSDNDGICDAEDICNGGPEPGQTCEDENPNTIDDIVQPDCSCMGTNTGGSANCDIVQFIGGNEKITLSFLTAQSERIEIIGKETNYESITICDGYCSNPQIIPNLITGQYTVKLYMTGNDGSNCYREEKIKVEKFECLDSDGDTTCDEEDICNGIPEPGSPCDDGNPHTINDVIHANCSCAGISGGSNGLAVCDDIEFIGGEEQLSVGNLTAQSEMIEIIGKSTNWQPLIICDQNCEDVEIVKNLREGQYTVKVQMFGSDGVNCYTEEKVKVKKSSSSRNTNLEPQPILFPNPAHNQVMLQLADFINKTGQVRILNYLGKEVTFLDFDKIPSEQIHLDTKDMTNGIYLVQIKLENRPVITKKLIINRLY